MYENLEKLLLGSIEHNDNTDRIIPIYEIRQKPINSINESLLYINVEGNKKKVFCNVNGKKLQVYIDDNDRLYCRNLYDNIYNINDYELSYLNDFSNGNYITLNLNDIDDKTFYKFSNSNQCYKEIKLSNMDDDIISVPIPQILTINQIKLTNDYIKKMKKEVEKIKKQSKKQQTATYRILNDNEYLKIVKDIWNNVYNINNNLINYNEKIIEGKNASVIKTEDAYANITNEYYFFNEKKKGELNKIISIINDFNNDIKTQHGFLCDIN